MIELLSFGWHDNEHYYILPKKNHQPVSQPVQIGEGQVQEEEEEETRACLCVY